MATCAYAFQRTRVLEAAVMHSCLAHPQPWTLQLVQVPFDQPMQPVGNVEVWLGEVERRMRSSVRAQVSGRHPVATNACSVQGDCDTT